MARFDLADLPDELLTFVTERHLATLTTLRPDGSPHVAPVGFTFDHDAGRVRVITWSASVKYRNLVAHPGSRAAVCQVDGGRWLTFEGPAIVTMDPQRCREGTDRYARRYREPKQRTDRAVIEITVDTILGRA